MKEVDAAIIGFGTAGKALALALADDGSKVAVIERSDDMYGGTCPNVACIPTKALVYAAEVSETVGGSFDARAQRYTVAIDEKNRMVREQRSRTYNALANHPNIQVIDGSASFTGPTTLCITSATGTEELEAQDIFIATGSSPIIPPIPGTDGPRVYTSEELIEIRALPQRLVIIGGGYIGMEFASMYANFGSEVTVLQGSEAFLPREDPEIAAAVLESLRERGIQVLLNMQVQRIENAVEETVVVAAEEGGAPAGAKNVEPDGNAHEPAKSTDEAPAATPGQAMSFPADAVLIATGRKPNVDGLNVEAAGVQVGDHGGIATDKHLRAAMPHVWAMGDVRGKLQFTYVAYDDYRIVASDLMSDGSRTAATRGAVPYAVFTDPPFSRVGMTEQEARDAGYSVQVATLPSSQIARARISEKPVGLLKAVVDAETERILGMHLFCIESPELVNLAKVAMDADVPYTELRDAVFTHPTMAESLNNLFAKVGREA